MFAYINQSIHTLIGQKFGQRTERPKTPSFTISPATSDIECGRNGEESPKRIEEPSEETKNELDSALATFYEEITNAAKQVFAGMYVFLLII